MPVTEHSLRPLELVLFVFQLRPDSPRYLSCFPPGDIPYSLKNYRQEYREQEAWA